MAFDRSGRPREPQRGFHGRTIPLEHGSKGAQLHAGTGATGQEPRVQRVGVTLTEHRRTLLSQLLHVRECGVLRKPFHTGLCLCCPLGDGLEKEPGELACCWQPWGSRLVRHGRTLAVGMEPLGDEGARPPHALLPALPPSTCLSGTALGPACREGGERALHFPGAPITRLIGRHGPGPEPQTDGGPRHATGRRALADALAVGRVGRHLLRAVAACGLPGSGHQLEPWRTPLPGQGPGCSGELRRRRRTWRPRRWLAGQHVTERWGDPLALARPPLAEMAQQVQAIGALENLRRPCRRATGVIWGAVAGHDFHAWMSTPPCCHRVGRALGQESHRPRLCELDQHHALDATCAERNIIDAQHTGGSP